MLSVRCIGVSAAAIVLLVAIAGCDGDPSGPVPLAPVYELESADNERLPVRSFRTISNAAGTCVYDLVHGVLSFGGTNSYTLVFSYEVRCAGDPVASPAHDTSQGTYTRFGDELTLVPRAHGTFTIQRVQLHTGAATVEIRMNAGDQYRFRFVETAFLGPAQE